MPTYQVYVRGHGGNEPQRLPPSEELPIELVTLGEYGCTMEGVVADTLIEQHWNTDRIQQDIQDERLIYWTHAQRDDWHERRQLQFVQPRLERHAYRTLHYNLVLQGAAELGDCGVCYWNAPKSEITWLARLGDREELLLSEILGQLREALANPDDTIQLYWTACLDADHWRGSRKAVSFHPTKAR